MGSRFLTFVACVLLGFVLLNSSGDAGPELYVSPLAPMGYRAPAGLPPAVAMTANPRKSGSFEFPEAVGEYSRESLASRDAWLAWLPKPRQQDSGYDWRMNETDWRFQLVSCLPFGLLFIVLSLQRSERAEQRRALEEECDITAIAGMVPPEKCRQLAMA
jgi:hypothetical protein